MKAQPLSKKIYDKAIEYGITEIQLEFSGGDDQGYLNIELHPYKKSTPIDFSSEIEDWVWNVYEYSGAGDGNAYGDTITYDLKSGNVTTSEWYTSIVEGDSSKLKLEIDNNEEQDS